MRTLRPARRQLTLQRGAAAAAARSGTIRAFGPESIDQMPLSVVILAAGQGKRMKSDLPKVLQPLAGRPLLAHVVETARRLGPEAIHIVYGHGGERVRAALPAADLHWVLQAEQKGTGHALAQRSRPRAERSSRYMISCFPSTTTSPSFR